MGKAQLKMDEFAFVILAGIILIGMLMIIWSTPSEALAIVDPTSISLTLQRGTSTTVNLNISGATNVSLSAVGDTSSWISFTKNNFDARYLCYAFIFFFF